MPKDYYKRGEKILARKLPPHLGFEHRLTSPQLDELAIKFATTVIGEQDEEIERLRGAIQEFTKWEYECKSVSVYCPVAGKHCCGQGDDEFLHVPASMVEALKAALKKTEGA